MIGALVRNSEMFSTAMRRALVPGEAAELMGIGPCFTRDMYGADDLLYDVGPTTNRELPPLLRALSSNSTFSESTLKSFIGNTMLCDIMQAILISF